jgi:hypothetical protein
MPGGSVVCVAQVLICFCMCLPMPDLPRSWCEVCRCTCCSTIDRQCVGSAVRPAAAALFAHMQVCPSCRYRMDFMHLLQHSLQSLC